MKKFILLMLFGCFLFSSCYNRRNGRTNWTKDVPEKQTEQQVKHS